MTTVSYDNFLTSLVPLVDKVIVYTMYETPLPYLGAGISNHTIINKRKPNYIYGYLTRGYNNHSFYLYIFTNVAEPWRTIIDRYSLEKIKLENVREIGKQEKTLLREMFTNGRTRTFESVRPSEPLYGVVMNALKE